MGIEKSMVKSRWKIAHGDLICVKIVIWLAAVSCVADGYMLGGVGLGFWLTGNPGRAWVGAWVSALLKPFSSV